MKDLIQTKAALISMFKELAASSEWDPTMDYDGNGCYGGKVAGICYELQYYIFMNDIMYVSREIDEEARAFCGYGDNVVSIQDDVFWTEWLEIAKFSC